MKTPQPTPFLNQSLVNEPSSPLSGSFPKQSETFKDVLSTLRAYQDRGCILPFSLTSVCRTATNQNRKLFERMLRKAEDQILLPAEVETLARLSLDFKIDRTLIGPHKIGALNSENVRKSQVDIIRKTTHQGTARYESDDQILYEALRQQDQTISVKVISEAINALPDNKRSLGINILAIASNFSSIHSLFELSNQPEIQSGKIYRFGSGSISESLKYLHKKSPSDFRAKFTNRLDLTAVIVLDEITIAKIAKDPKLQREIINTRAQLVLPVGLDNGISVYSPNGITHESLKDQLFKNISSAEKILKEKYGGASDYETVQKAIAEAISEPLLDKLPEEIRTKVKLITPEQPQSIAQITTKMAGPKHIQTVEQVANMMIGMPGGKEELDLFRDYLIRNITFFSDIKIAESLQKIQQNISQISSGKATIFYLPKTEKAEESKSYHLIINQFIRTNGIQDAVIVEGTDQLRNITRDMARGKHPDSQVVLIDDFAGTGSSLFKDYQDIRKVFTGQLAICTLATTEKAITIAEDEEPFSPGFRGFAKIEEVDPNFYFIPAEIVSNFGPKCLSNYTASEEMILYTMCGTLGYGNIGTCVMFPYMTPNNNISAVEPFSICFTNGVGVKNTVRSGT